jgi:hypothetical protein
LAAAGDGETLSIWKEEEDWRRGGARARSREFWAAVAEMDLCGCGFGEEKG